MARQLEERRAVGNSRLGAGCYAGLCQRWPELRAVLLLFLLSRLAFYVVALPGSWLVPENTAEPARLIISAPLALHWRWDAIYYLHIASNGYQPNGITAFFPLLPLLIWLVATLLGGLQPPAALPSQQAEQPLLLAGVLVAHGAALLAFWLLYELARAETGEPETARRAVLYALSFPLAFYYAVPYTEGLFLATSLGLFLAARRGHWLRAGLWAAAASATRNVGLLLLPALALEIVLAWRRGELHQPGARWRALAGLGLAPLGLLLFMLHLWQRVGDPLAFVNAQSDWNHAFVLPLTTLWRGINYALHPSWSKAPDIYMRGLIQTLIVLGVLAVLLASWRSWRPGYLLYGLLLITLVLSSPLSDEWTMHSQGRYLMVLFPIYITLARWGRRPAVHQAILLLWLPLLGLLTVLYVCWYPVA